MGDLGVRILREIGARRHLTPKQLTDILNKGSGPTLSVDAVREECEFLERSKHLRFLPAAYTTSGLKHEAAT